MTAIQRDRSSRAALRVGDQVQVHTQAGLTLGRVSAVHRQGNGIEYVVRTDAHDGGMGGVVNVWTTSARSSYLVPLADSGEQP